MRTILGALALLPFVMTSALAQQAAQQQPQFNDLTAAQTEIMIGADLGRAQTEMEFVLRGYKTEIARLRQHEADMTAYLKACGDKPGCTQPAGN